MMAFVLLSLCYSVAAFFLALLVLKLERNNYTTRKDVTIWLLLSLVPYVNAILAFGFFCYLIYILCERALNSKWLNQEAKFLRKS